MNDDIEIKEIELNVPKKYIVKTDVKNINNIIKKIKNGDYFSNEDDKLKLKLDMTTEEFKFFKETKDYKELLQKGVKIQLQRKKDNKEKDDEKTEKEDNINFLNVLEKLVYEDEILVQKLYQEIIVKQ